MKRILIAAGTAHYDHLPAHLQRPKLTKVVELVADFFTDKLGYSRELEAVSTDPESRDLARQLDRWFGSPERDPLDWVVFYYTGHGEWDGESFSLLTRDSEDGYATTTGITAEQLGRMLTGGAAGGEKRRVKNCMFILDTCFSGAAALEIAGKLGKFFKDGDLGSFYLLAATLPREEALAGKLAGALIEAINDESLAGAYQRVIFFDQLRFAVNRRLSPHNAFGAGLASSSEEPEFFPNPRYKADLPSGATVAEVRRALADPTAMKIFWGPTSRGVELEAQPGWHFTGRKRILNGLSGWLADKADHRTRVVTGEAGSGKSAILAKIVTLADPQVRSRIPSTAQEWSQAFPSGCVDLAIHAKGKTCNEVKDRLAGFLGVEADQEKLFAALQSREQPLRLVVDALDEAREPERIAEELLAPLNPMPAVKLLVGTRPKYKDMMGQGAVQLHVDQPEYFEKNDLADYVQARLLRREEGETRTPYCGKESLAREVAVAVADTAYPNFLTARLVVEGLLAAPKTMEPGTASGMEFPATVGKAFEQYLARFGEDEKRVRDLLIPLAWAEGVGLPWEDLWAAVATAIADRTYDNNDIHWVLDHAGSFVVETLEQGRSVYRLYHQALADYLIMGSRADAMVRMFNALRESVPLLEGKPGWRDWRLAHPYVRVHLAEYAHACGQLAGLVREPLFLLAADPDRLLSLMETHPDEVREEIARVYKLNFHHIRKPIDEAAAYLEMTAHKCQARELADQIAQLPLVRPWRVGWASWQPAAIHRVLARHTQAVNALAVAEHQGRTVIISGSDDKSIRVWDLERGTPVGKPLEGHTGRVKALAVAQHQGRTVIVSGSDDQSIRVWDLERGTPVGRPLHVHNGGVDALAVTQHEGRTVIIFGSWDQSIGVWDLERDKRVGEPFDCHTVNVKALTVAQHQGRTVIIASSDDKSIRVWDLKRGTQVGRPLEGHSSLVRALAVAQHQGRTMIISGSEDDSIRVWDLESGTLVGKPLEAHTNWVYSLAVAEHQGRTVIISGSDDKSIRVWDLERGTPMGEPLEGHAGFVRALAVAQYEGRTVIISGSLDTSIRIWDLERGTPVGRPLHVHNGGVYALAVAQHQGRTVIVSGSDDKSIRVWDLERGTPVGKPLEGHCGDVNALAVVQHQGRTVIVSGSDDKSIRVWDLERGTPVGKPLEGHYGDVNALAVAQHQGHTVIISSGGDRIVLVWDLERGTLVGEPLEGHTGWVRALAVTQHHGRTVIISGSLDTRILVWELERGTCVGELLDEHARGVYALVVAQHQRRKVFISGCSDRSILVWDLERGTLVGEPLEGHTGWVRALAVAQHQGRKVIISGSSDESIRVWDMESLEMTQEIDIGAPVYSLAVSLPTTVAVGTSMGLLVIQLSEGL